MRQTSFLMNKDRIKLIWASAANTRRLAPSQAQPFDRCQLIPIFYRRIQHISVPRLNTCFANADEENMLLYSGEFTDSDRPFGTDYARDHLDRSIWKYLLKQKPLLCVALFHRLSR
jgi:hypothetical protein